MISDGPEDHHICRTRLMAHRPRRPDGLGAATTMRPDRRCASSRPATALSVTGEITAAHHGGRAKDRWRDHPFELKRRPSRTPDIIDRAGVARAGTIARCVAASCGA